MRVARGAKEWTAIRRDSPLAGAAFHHTFDEMICRRTFLKRAGLAGAAAAVSGSWLTLSNSRAARLGRRLVEDSRRAILPSPAKPNPAQWSDNKVTMAWLGHSTVLINFYGLRILTDPVLKNRVGFSTGLGTIGLKRLVAPALSLKELPPIDVVLLSHAHYDHFDTPTLEGLGQKPCVVTANSTGDLLGSFKNVRELGWGERETIQNGNGDLTVEAIQVKHWGERWPSKLKRGYNGYILRREGKSLLFGGDTAFTPAFAEAKSRGPFIAALMPVGAYDPWIGNHCNPEQAVAMANAAGALYIVPIHHQTFKLSNEPALEPIERLEAALQKEPERLALRKIGETFVC
jgi:L-ascorbate metabolism protein UlaG (beta-lactamase superfamily)